MRRLSPQLTPELREAIGSQDVAKAAPLPVANFRDLMHFVARLAYANKDHLLFFRGQTSDYKNRAGASSFYPTIYRGERLARDELDIRFEELAGAGARLADAFDREKIEGAAEVRRRKIIQWSILQHYEVCPTPLLDFTQSLRVACSFATMQPSSEPHVYVFGLPYLTNRISINSEQDLVNVRLLSICPPDAFRPYYQEGYLAGTDEITTEYLSKDELDFNNRLIAKFSLPPDKSFWRAGFDPIPKKALYPGDDRMAEICADIGREVGNAVRAADLGQFLKTWTTLESRLLSMARTYKDRVYSVGEALRILHDAKQLGPKMAIDLDHFRLTRNKAVHRPDALEPGEIQRTTREIESALKLLRSEPSAAP